MSEYCRTLERLWPHFRKMLLFINGLKNPDKAFLAGNVVKTSFHYLPLRLAGSKSPVASQGRLFN